MFSKSVTNCAFCLWRCFLLEHLRCFALATLDHVELQGQFAKHVWQAARYDEFGLSFERAMSLENGYLFFFVNIVVLQSPWQAVTAKRLSYQLINPKWRIYGEGPSPLLQRCTWLYFFQILSFWSWERELFYWIIQFTHQFRYYKVYKHREYINIHTETNIIEATTIPLTWKYG